MRCPKCNAVVQDGARFCGRCRHEISAGGAGQANSAPPQEHGQAWQRQQQPQQYQQQQRANVSPSPNGPRPYNPTPVNHIPNATPAGSAYAPTKSMAAAQRIPKVAYIAVNAVLMVTVTVFPWIDPYGALGPFARGITWESLPILGLSTAYDILRIIFAGPQAIEAVGVGFLFGTCAFSLVCMASWAASMFFLVKSVVDEARGRDANHSAFFGAVCVAISAAFVIASVLLLIGYARWSLGVLGAGVPSPFALITIWCWLSLAMAIGAAVFRKICPAQVGAVGTQGAQRNYYQ